MSQKRLFLAFILALLVISFGTVGYMYIEGWSFLDSLYMTIITIATVGFREVGPPSPQGMVFTIILILVGMGFLLFSVSTFTAFLVEGEINVIFRRRKMMKKISELKNHYIVCGAGQIGMHIIDELIKTQRNFVVVEKSEDVCKKLSENKILYVQGDATYSHVLKSANIENAKGLFCALSSDGDNLLLIITAKALNPKLRIISKANEDESREKMKNAGADGVILPMFIGGLRMASEMIRPTAVNFLDEMLKRTDQIYRVEDISFDEQSKFIGKKLKDTELFNKKGITVVALKRANQYIFNPAQDESINAGDSIVIIGEAKEIREIKNRIK